MSLSSKEEKQVDCHVGQRIKHRRIILGLSRQDIGQAINVSVQQINKYETAENRVACSKLFSLSKFLKVPIQYFFDMLNIDGSNIHANNQHSVNIVAEDQEGFHFDNVISEREIMRLTNVYKRLKSSTVRKKVFELLESIIDGRCVDDAL